MPPRPTPDVAGLPAPCLTRPEHGGVLSRGSPPPPSLPASPGSPSVPQPCARPGSSLPRGGSGSKPALGPAPDPPAALPASPATGTERWPGALWGRAPGWQGLHLRHQVCSVAPPLQAGSPRSPGTFQEQLCDAAGVHADSRRGELDYEEGRGRLGLSGGLLAPSCFRSATQLPLQPLAVITPREQGGKR